MTKDGDPGARERTLRLAVGQLDDASGRALGTAFAISGHHLVTSLHCLRTAAGFRKSARVRFPAHPLDVYREVTVEVTLADERPEADLALLECRTPLPANLVPLVPTAAVPHGRWHTIAWPDELEGYVDGVHFSGVIEGLTVEHHRPALELRCAEAAAGEPASVHGASGAPVIADDLGPRSVVGVIRWNPESRDRPGAAQGGRVFAAPAGILLTAWAKQVPAANPYKPPLVSYGANDAEEFFGRSLATRELIRSLQEADSPVLTLWGASGSGKSSLVRAGLLPKIASGEVRGPHGTPGADWKIHGVLENYDDLDLATLQAVQPTQSGRGLLVLDQFERVFTLPPERSSKWCDAIVRVLVARPQLTTIVVVRADYLAVLARETELNAYVSRGLTYVDLALTRDDVRDMCLLPAARDGLSFDPAVVGRISDDVIRAHPMGRVSDRGRAEPTALPLVNALLWRLAERVGPSRHVTEDLYDQVGGVAGALSEWAGEAFVAAVDGADAGRPPGLTDALDRILLKLVRVGAHEREPATRAFVEHGVLLQAAPLSQARAAVDLLRRKGLVIVGIGSDNRIALMHDALISQWDRLRELVDRETSGLRWKAAVFDGAVYGAAPEQMPLPDHLLDRAEQERAEHPKIFSVPENRLIDAAARARRRARRRRRAMRASSAAAALLLIAGIGVGFTLGRRGDAVDRARLTASANLEAAASRLLKDDYRTARELALESYRLNTTDATRNLLLSTLLAAPGLVPSAGVDGSAAVRPNRDDVIETSADDDCLRTGTPSTDLPYCVVDSSPDVVVRSSNDQWIAAAAHDDSGRLSIATWRKGSPHTRRRWSFPGSVRGAIMWLGSSELAVSSTGDVAVTIGGEGLLLSQKGPQHPIRIPSSGVDVATVSFDAEGRTLMITETATARDPHQSTPHIWLYRVDGSRIVLVGNFFAKTPSEDALVLAPDGRSVLVVSEEEVSRVDGSSGRSTRIVGLPSGFSPSTVALSPSGGVLAAASSTEIVRVDLRTHAVRLQAINEHIGLIEGVNQSGDVAMSGDVYKDVYSDHGADALHARIFIGGSHDNEPWLTISPDNRYVAVISGAKLSVVDWRSGAAVLKTRYPAMIDSLMWRNGHVMTLVVENRSVHALDVQGAGRALGTIPDRYSMVSVDRTGLSATVVDGEDPEAVGIWDVTHARLRMVLRPELGRLTSAVLSADGRAAAVLGGDRGAIISGLSDSEAPRTEQLAGTGVEGLFTPRFIGSHAPTAADASRVVAAEQLMISADGQRVLTSTAENLTLHTAGERDVVLDSGTGNNTTMSAAGTRIAWADTASDIAVSDLGTPWLQVPDGQLEGDFGSQGTISNATLSDDGQLLAATFDGVLHVLNLDPEAWISFLCSQGLTEISEDDFAKYARNGNPVRICR